MWLTKLLDSISHIFPSDPIEDIKKSLARVPQDRRLDPEKFYVETVRYLLGVSEQRAADICEAAVRQGFLKRGIEVLCPDDTVAASAESEAKLPATVRCWKEEDGEVFEDELPTSSLRRLTYYRLNEQGTAALYARTV
jgi:hypothetical protein